MGQVAHISEYDRGSSIQVTSVYSEAFDWYNFIYSVHIFLDSNLK